MMNDDKVLTGIVLDTEIRFTLVEICQACTVETDFIVELVEEGVLEPVGIERSEWRFAGTDLQRATLALRLQRDLGLNLEGVALSLQLLEEIRELRVRVETNRDN